MFKILLAFLAYGVFLLAFSFYSIYAIHHLNEFGYSGDASQRMLKVYIGFTVTVLTLTVVGVISGLVSL
ncbi:hypothetical protein KC644_00850 [Candidatus Berkelbacteria bacterium]|nr:hypothetical protein [Candidatus Berkelbacteria bacterium]